MKKIIINLFIGLIICCLNFPLIASAELQACNPQDVKPADKTTRLVDVSVSPDIVPVGQLMTVMAKTNTGLRNLYLNMPKDVEIVDYYPKTLANINIEPGKWINAGSDLPIGQYSVTVKINQWTAGEWKTITFSAMNDQGTGYGTTNYFAYYDTVSVKISLEDRNQAPQTTKDVIRKVTVTTAPQLRVTLSTDKGELGSTISQKQGNSATLTTNANGEAYFFLFTQEKEKVTLTAKVIDSCQDSSASQKFTIARSDVARTYKDSNWFWWIIGLVILLVVIIIIFLIIRRKKKSQIIENTATQQQVQSSLGQESSQIPKPVSSIRYDEIKNPQESNNNQDNQQNIS